MTCLTVSSIKFFCFCVRLCLLKSAFLLLVLYQPHFPSQTYLCSKINLDNLTSIDWGNINLNVVIPHLASVDWGKIDWRKIDSARGGIK